MYQRSGWVLNQFPTPTGGHSDAVYFQSCWDHGDDKCSTFLILYSATCTCEHRQLTSTSGYWRMCFLFYLRILSHTLSDSATGSASLGKQSKLRDRVVCSMELFIGDIPRSASTKQFNLVSSKRPLVAQASRNIDRSAKHKLRVKSLARKN